MHDINYYSLVYIYCLSFVLIAVMTYNRIPITKRAITAIVRMSVQLFIASMVLKYVFDVESIILTTGVYLFMVIFATYTAFTNSSLKRKSVFFSILIAVFVSGTSVLLLILALVVKFDPWYSPRYLIPLAGMLLGNSMNSCALALERFTSEIKNSADVVENNLAMGATPFESCLKYIKKGVQASVTPTITTMMSTGVVSIPGMMSGQILAGSDPRVAFKYQLVVMMGIFCSLAVNISIALLSSYRIFFTKDYKLKRDITM